jgi:hypothetical protein
VALKKRRPQIFIRTFDGVDLNDPVEAAEGRRVFALHPLR